MAVDGGNLNLIVKYEAYNKENVISSGGISLPYSWVKVGTNIWKLKLVAKMMVN